MAAREHYSAENLGEITVTSNTVWGSACTLSPTLANTADYLVFWNVELTNQSNTTADAQARVTVGGTAVATMNVENRNTSEWGAYSGFFKVTGTGSPLTIALEVKAETNGNNIVARNRRLTVLRMGAGDVYAESTANQAVTAGGTTNWADILSTSFTPAAGDYLVLGHSMSSNYATTTSVYAKFVFDGVAESNTEVAVAGHAEIAAGQKNLVPLNKQRVYSVATGGVSRTVTWQGRSNQNGFEVGFSENRLLILRLADFAAHHSAWLSELSWSQETPTDVLSISPTVTANPHLLIGSWYNNNTSNANSLVSTLLDDADDDQDAAATTSKAFNTGDTRGQGASFAGVRSYTAGTRPISLKVNASGVGEWASTMASSAFTLLDLGADDASVPVTVSPSVGALATAGLAPTVIGAKSVAITPAIGSATISGLIPTISASQSSASFPTTGAMTVNGLVPTVSAAQAITISVGLGSISLTGFAPSVGGGVAASISVGMGLMNLTGFAPAARSAVMVAPAVGSVSLQGQTPAVIAAQSVTIPVGTGTLSINGQSPMVAGKAAPSPLTASLSLSGHLPTVAASATVEPALAAPLAASGHAPASSTGARLQHLSLGLLINGLEPAVQTGGAVTVQPLLGMLVLTGLQPTVSAKADIEVEAGPVIVITGHDAMSASGVRITPSNDNLEVVGFAPEATGRAVSAPLPASLALAPLTVSVSAGMLVTAEAVAMSLTGFAPVLSDQLSPPTDPGKVSRTFAIPKDVREMRIAGDVREFKIPRDS